MNIGAIGTSNYWYHNNRTVQKEGTKSFGDTVVNKTSNLVIHGLMGEKTEAGDTVVGAWGMRYQAHQQRYINRKSVILLICMLIAAIPMTAGKVHLP